jgi:hypothetical protein
MRIVNIFKNLFQRVTLGLSKRAMLKIALACGLPLTVLPFDVNVKVKHYDADGNLIAEHDTANGITNVGKNKILDDMFNDGTQTANASWYIGLIDNSGYTALADTDTMASHSGWNEFTTYSEANRVAWGSGAAASQSTTNSTPATFNITGSATVKGVFITTNNTKSGSTGTLWATALFSADVPVSNGDQLKVTYTVSA